MLVYVGYFCLPKPLKLSLAIFTWQFNNLPLIVGEGQEACHLIYFLACTQVFLDVLPDDIHHWKNSCRKSRSKYTDLKDRVSVNKEICTGNYKASCMSSKCLKQNYC